MISRVILLICATLWFSAAHSVENRRYALVIGNATYPARPLLSAKNDAREMGRVLTEIGFEVDILENQSGEALKAAMQSFTAKASEPNRTSILYFSGHGAQQNGQNLLVGIDNTKASDSTTTLNIQNALSNIKRQASSSAIIILDTCRLELASSEPIAINIIKPPPGILIASATSPDTVARSGKSPADLSIYTKHLVRNLTSPGLTLSTILEEVRTATAKETQQIQVSEERSTLTQRFFPVPLPRNYSELQPRGTRSTNTTDDQLDAALADIRGGVGIASGRTSYELVRRRVKEVVSLDLSDGEITAIAKVPFSSGARFAPVPDFAKNYLGASHGLLVTQIEDTGLARELGIREGDIVTNLAGKEVRTKADLDEIVSLLRTGTTVKFTLLRNRVAAEYQANLNGSSLYDLAFEAAVYNFADKKYDRTRQILERFADYGYGPANAILAQLAWAGLGGRSQQDVDEFIKRAQLSADSGNTKGLFWLTIGHLYGKGVPKSEVRANELRSEGALRGESWAFAGLANANLTGAGAEKNLTKAWQFAERAAMQGSWDGMFLLGQMYEKGLGVDMNVDMAKVWYARVIETGNIATSKMANDRLRALR